MDNKPLVAERRRYKVITVKDAKTVVSKWLKHKGIAGTAFGLPEVDDRYHVWRVPIVHRSSTQRAGECVVDAKNGTILESESTNPDVIVARLNAKATGSPEPKLLRGTSPVVSQLKNTVALGDAEQTLTELPEESVNLVFTSPPYYNARPEYHEYVDYADYLSKMERIIAAAHRVLSEGRFFVINISPVLIRRSSRSEASQRIAVPFDFHRLFVEVGFDFVDDIHWVKPSGAGWATGRGRRFSADRQPLQYKAVPVTEYILVYRKRTNRLIDWNIRFHPDQEAVRSSKISGEYDVTNLWRIKPAHSRLHPAIFPVLLAEKVIRYYSFINDVVLDPFAGIGTVGKAAIGLDRRFVLVEKEKQYVDVICQSCGVWFGENVINEVQFINCMAPDVQTRLF